MGTSLVAQTVKHLPTVQETWVRSLGWEDSLGKEMATHSRILGQKSLAGYSPWGHKELDMTQVTQHTHMGRQTCQEGTTVLPLALKPVF